MGFTKELVLCVADNGKSIPSTIFDRFKSDHLAVPDKFSNRHAAYKSDSLSVVEKGEITYYATLAGVTRKESGGGMGLTYIKKDTIDSFAGKLWIVGDGVCSKYSETSDRAPIVEEWSAPWTGNLLRIALPIVEK